MKETLVSLNNSCTERGEVTFFICCGVLSIVLGKITFEVRVLISPRCHAPALPTALFSQVRREEETGLPPCLGSTALTSTVGLWCKKMEMLLISFLSAVSHTCWMSHSKSTLCAATWPPAVHPRICLTSTRRLPTSGTCRGTISEDSVDPRTTSLFRTSILSATAKTLSFAVSQLLPMGSWLPRRKETFQHFLSRLVRKVTSLSSIPWPMSPKRY